ncbi:hypothetical protein OIU85_002199 [Salix viminalis]|uniref:Uncharacterized protein n=1 Tax=Salix viminalis TaxID=40686 RepID=A0A9Q0VQE3_SALVM|nr:hypothetical protein OIU85_002199 [Salix viminalis]
MAKSLRAKNQQCAFVTVSDFNARFQIPDFKMHMVPFSALTGGKIISGGARYMKPWLGTDWQRAGNRANANACAGFHSFLVRNRSGPPDGSVQAGMEWADSSLAIMPGLIAIKFFTRAGPELVARCRNGQETACRAVGRFSGNSGIRWA